MEKSKAIGILQAVKAGTADVFISKAPIKDALNMAIAALEQQEADKCCETCRHKYGSQQESPCCDCYLATAYEDCYEAEEES